LDWLVLVKVVPDADTVRYDPGRRALIRDGVDLFANPFDQRAVRVALDTRAPGEQVTVVSMGPPNAGEALLESLALGVDRAVLVSDPALAGSDTLVTARVLARAATRLTSDVLLAGRWSTDSETGQVGPQIATLLQRPYVSAARRLARRGNDGLEVEADTETGAARYRIPVPAVVSIGEKIAKLLKPTDAAREAASRRGVERWSLAEVGLAPDQVGEGGSPTIVGRLREVAPTRSPRCFEDGPVAERATQALAAARELVRRPKVALEPLTTARNEPSAGVEFLAFVSDARGGLSTSGERIVAEIRRSVPRARISVGWVGREPTPPEREALGREGASEVRWVEHRAERIEDAVAAAGVSELLLRNSALMGLVFDAGEFGRAVAGRVAASHGLGLTGDAVGLDVEPDGTLAFWKPAFGGGILAEVRSRTRPALATLRPGPSRSATVGAVSDVPVTRVAATLPAPRLEFLGESVELDDDWRSPADARLVVAVGLGVGGPDGVAAVRSIAASWGAAVVATRKVVDAGWVPRQLQVGLTGQSLEPDLAILVGASARPNHLIGFRRAGTILAVNADPATARSSPVDLAIAGRWDEVLPELTRQGRAWLRDVAAGAG